MAKTGDIDIRGEYVNIVNALIQKLELAASSGIAFVERRKEATSGILSVTGNENAKVAFAVDHNIINPKAPFSNDPGKLFEKIIASVLGDGMKDGAPCIVFTGPVKNPGAIALKADIKIIVAFGQATAKAFNQKNVEAKTGSFVDYMGKRVMLTFGLEELSEDPELKKKTWGHLKKVIAELNGIK